MVLRGSHVRAGPEGNRKHRSTLPVGRGVARASVLERPDGGAKPEGRSSSAGQAPRAIVRAGKPSELADARASGGAVSRSRKYHERSQQYAE